MARFAPFLVGWRPYALLGALCMALYLPGMTAIPVLDRDEARFAQATRQMLETGDFLHIRFQSEARNQKPAGIYWLQAASVSALSSPTIRLTCSTLNSRTVSLIASTCATTSVRILKAATTADDPKSA